MRVFGHFTVLAFFAVLIFGAMPLVSAQERAEMPCGTLAGSCCDAPQRHEPRDRRRGEYMSDREFDLLYNKVKNKSFRNDRLELIEVGSLDSRFACRQCRKMMELFTFDDDRMEVLRLMGCHVVDPENAALVTDAFTFDSKKHEAALLLRSR